ncbi:MAG: transketolase [Phycisphaerae bacterium]
MPLSDHDLALKANRLRGEMLRIIKHAGAGHTGGGLSSIDILTLLYNRILRVSPESRLDPNRDRYIQSKGHSVEALYVVLADRGFFPMSDLETLCHYNSPYVGHPTKAVPGCEQNTGGLGHGLPMGVGCAIAAKKDNKDFRTYVLMGDGELAEGSNWEAAMAAAHYDLDNLIAIVDHNTLQISGRTRDVCSNDPLDEKFRAFGWDVHTCDGHDFSALTPLLIPPIGLGKPRVVIANTVKGKGVSFMEDVAKWHHGVPTDKEYEAALSELESRYATLSAAK